MASADRAFRAAGSGWTPTRCPRIRGAVATRSTPLAAPWPGSDGAALRRAAVAPAPGRTGLAAAAPMNATAGRSPTPQPAGAGGATPAGERLRRVRRRDTAAERALRSELHRRGFRFRVDARAESGIRTRADLLFPRARLAVFVDGCFWHGCPDHATWPRHRGEWWRQKILANQTRDRRNRAALEAAGWMVVSIWEHEDEVAAADRVERALEPRDGRRRPPARPSPEPRPAGGTADPRIDTGS